MQSRTCLLLMLALTPATVAAQATASAAAARPASTAPVADALRQMEQRFARNLIAAAEAMPAEKYSYRPTPAQMSLPTQ